MLGLRGRTRSPPAGHTHFHPLPHAREPAGPQFNYGKALTSLALMNYIKFKHVLKLYFINKKPWARFGDAAFSGEDAFIPVTPLASFQEHLSPPSPCASNISPRGRRSPGPPPPGALQGIPVRGSLGARPRRSRRPPHTVGMTRPVQGRGHPVGVTPEPPGPPACALPTETRSAPGTAGGGGVNVALSPVFSPGAQVPAGPCTGSLLYAQILFYIF